MIRAKSAGIFGGQRQRVGKAQWEKIVVKRDENREMVWKFERVKKKDRQKNSRALRISINERTSRSPLHPLFTI